MEITNFRAGFVSIVGKPNVGKSTLMNRLLGEKLSIVTPKPQTTRTSIRGFYNSDVSQIIYLDTPGFLEPRYELHTKMQGYITDSLKNTDMIVFLADATDFLTDYDQKIIEIIKSYRKPAIGVLNKIELCNQEQLKEKQSILNEHFDKTFSISALKDSNFAGLIKEIEGFLPYSPPLYSQEDLSDMPLRFFAQEIIREKIFLEYGDEIPYSSTVVVEKWIEEPDRDVIKANIWIERDSQKPIILGKNGVKIGILRTKSENDIKAFTGRGVSLNLWVKVKPDWRKKNGALKEFGY